MRQYFLVHMHQEHREHREHKEGWGSYYKVIKRVKFVSALNKEKDDFIWEKQLKNCIVD